MTIVLILILSRSYSYFQQLLLIFIKNVWGKASKVCKIENTFHKCDGFTLNFAGKWILYLFIQLSFNL